MTTKYNVLIVEDQSLPRQLLEMKLKESERYNVVASIPNASYSDVYCSKYKVDVILMDVITKNGENGLDASEKIKAMNPSIKIIIVTSMVECSYIERAKSIGIESFWYKEYSDESIIDVLDRTMKGESVYPSSSPRVMIGQCPSDQFSERDIEVLRHIIEGETDKEIADSLYLSVETVHKRVKELLAKTGFKSRTKLAVEVRTSGFIIN